MVQRRPRRRRPDRRGAVKGAAHAVDEADLGETQRTAPQPRLPQQAHVHPLLGPLGLGHAVRHVARRACLRNALRAAALQAALRAVLRASVAPKAQLHRAVSRALEREAAPVALLRRRRREREVGVRRGA